MPNQSTRRQFLGSVGGLIWGGLTTTGVIPILASPPRASATSIESDLFPAPPISVAAFNQRIARIRSQMRTDKLDCLMVSSVLNHAVRYLGFFDPELQGRASGSSQLVSVLLPLEGDPVLFLQTFTAAEYLRPRAEASSYVKDVRLVGGDNQKVLQLAADQIRSWRLDSGRLGLAGGEIDWAEHLFFSQLLPCLDHVEANSMLNRLRIIKDDEEIGLMRHSAAIGDSAMVEVERYMAPGVTDRELYARAMASMIAAGGEEDTFVLMGIGPNQNAMLMELIDGRTLSKGNVIVYETLPFYRLYNTELAVTFSLGPVSAMQKRAADACQAAYEAGVAVTKPGIPVSNVVDAALAAFQERGFPSFTHTPGHFIGLDNYEGPSLRSHDTILQKGMIFSFHPNLVIPGQVKQEICGILLVTDHGVENLSQYPPRGIRVV
jgi:Xaa-Pro aminopeptidase